MALAKAKFNIEQKLEMKAANSKRKHRVSNNSVAAKSHAKISLVIALALARLAAARMASKA
jgi:hypothetical protein